jgi:ferrochelatase
MLEVAEHYYHFDGKSPINDHARALIATLEAELAAHGPKLPVYWGNRNWHPMLADTLRRMEADGVKRALGFVTSAFGSYSGCRQYLEDIERARAEVGPGAPQIDKLRTFHNHPGFIEAVSGGICAALEQVPQERRAAAHLVFTAHSVPVAMAQASPYIQQLEDACCLAAEAAGHPEWRLVYQSRSGPPGQPWLEPDICDYLRGLHANGAPRDLVAAPIGFLSDHLEVVYDLDTQTAGLCAELGIGFHRAATAGTHPAFIAMVRELIAERTEGRPPRSVGALGPGPNICAAGCCPTPRRPAMPPRAQAEGRA